MEISWADRAKTKVLQRVKGEKILHTIKKWKAKCIGHVMRRNCHSKQNTLLKEIQKGREDEDEGVTSSRQREVAGT